MAPRRWVRYALVPMLAGVVTGAGLLPSVQARGKALALLVEAVGGSFPRPLAPEVSRERTALDGVAGDLYRPDSPAPPMLLVLGAAPQGIGDPRAVRLARALARSGRTVFVPSLELAGQRFVEEDLDRIVRAALALEEHPAARGSVAVLGISYGGSLSLVAAADPRLAGRLALVATFGSYVDLVGVIQAVTTGTSVIGERRVWWEPHPLARAILERYAIGLLPEGSREQVQAALAGTGTPKDLDPDGRALYELLANRDPARTYQLAERLPVAVAEQLERFSPASVVVRVDAPVIAMHSTDDPAVPYGELVRLESLLPEARTVTVRAFRHVDLRASPGSVLTVAGDLMGAWRFASWLLEVQE